MSRAALGRPERAAAPSGGRAMYSSNGGLT